MALWFFSVLVVMRAKQQPASSCPAPCSANFIYDMKTKAVHGFTRKFLGIIFVRLESRGAWGKNKYDPEKNDTTVDVPGFEEVAKKLLAIAEVGHLF